VKISTKFDVGPVRILSDDHVFAEAEERKKYLFLFSFALLLLILAFCYNTPGEIWEGSLIILLSPANLITDYIPLTNVGATLFNAAVKSFFSIAMAAVNRVKITGAVVAAFFTVAGFSLFGKNLYNSIPIIAGVYLYCRLTHNPFKNHLMSAFFGTALAPLVSEVSFNLNLPVAAGIALGILAGIIVGMVLPQLASNFVNFHHGFNMYNIGFTSGIIGTFFIALFRAFNIEVAPVNIISSGNNQTFAPVFYSVFALMFIIGLYGNKWSLKGYGSILKQSGRLSTDFIDIAGFNLTLINMGLLGIISVSYVLLVGGELNGPSIGGIFTVVGFAAFGKHIKNITPVLVGIFFIGAINPYELKSTFAVLAALFGTTLAPISGYYGPIAGVIAGVLHMAMVMNVGYLHAGMNLYNNGFSGGFVAAGLIPVFECFIPYLRGKRKKSCISEQEETP
jgi:hypothetical protein